MPVWGLWQDDALWFSSSDRSRKTRNLTDDPRVSVASDDPHHPIVIQGRATAAIEPGERHAFARSLDAKYATNYGAEFYFESTVFKVIPAVVIAFDDSGLDQTATRWRF
jgi:nitroimidazol reductase NimA-like FMN-containing flavoprotein (pyridoxamine 5'-phosphate oxidase superfamily)